jgi:hypothetical protein
MKDKLFLLAAPFDDAKLSADQIWFCADCAMVEGALLANPHWTERVEIRRVAFPRPRAEVVALVGETEQGLPLLILAEGGPSPEGVRQVNGLSILHEGKPITKALALRYGGAGPHP